MNCIHRDNGDILRYNSTWNTNYEEIIKYQCKETKNVSNT